MRSTDDKAKVDKKEAEKKEAYKNADAVKAQIKAEDKAQRENDGQRRRVSGKRKAETDDKQRAAKFLKGAAIHSAAARGGARFPTFNGEINRGGLPSHRESDEVGMESSQEGDRDDEEGKGTDGDVAEGLTNDNDLDPLEQEDGNYSGELDPIANPNQLEAPQWGEWEKETFIFKGLGEILSNWNPEKSEAQSLSPNYIDALKMLVEAFQEHLDKSAIAQVAPTDRPMQVKHLVSSPADVRRSLTEANVDRLERLKGPRYANENHEVEAWIVGATGEDGTKMSPKNDVGSRTGRAPESVSDLSDDDSVFSQPLSRTASSASSVSGNDSNNGERDAPLTRSVSASREARKPSEGLKRTLQRGNAGSYSSHERGGGRSNPFERALSSRRD